MRDPRSFWLTMTNIVLGVAVFLLLAGVVTVVLCDLIARLRQRRKVSHELDEDMRRMFADWHRR